MSSRRRRRRSETRTGENTTAAIRTRWRVGPNGIR